MWITLLLSLYINSNALELRGKVTSLDGKDFLYTEIHNIRRDDKKLNQFIETKYLKPNGEVFGKMTSDFTKSALLPAIVFEDYRFKTKEEMTMDDDGKHVHIRVALDGKTPTEKTFAVDDSMVAGQGFDNFIKLNFATLEQKSKSLKFGVLTEEDFFSFKGYRISKDGEFPARFGIRISSFVLRLFLDELVVEYDKDHQLISYRGLSNIKSDRGAKQNVAISYEITKP